MIAPEVPGEFLQVELRMREGAPIQETIKSMELVRAALTRVEEAYVEDTGDRNGLVKHFATYGWDRINGVMIIELTKEDFPTFGGPRIAILKPSLILSPTFWSFKIFSISFLMLWASE